MPVLIINHRVNTIRQISSVPLDQGAEIDKSLELWLANDI